MGCEPDGVLAVYPEPGLNNMEVATPVACK